MEGFRFLSVGGNWSTWRKPTKVGMELPNQAHIQPMASCIGKRKVFEQQTNPPCHPDTEQNRPYKIPGPEGV